MKSKWFMIKGGWLVSKKTAHTIKEAWEKTLEKWKILKDTDYPCDGMSTCGLCDLYFVSDLCGIICKGCPIKKETGKSSCRDTPFGLRKRPYEELIFLEKLKRKIDRRKRVKNRSKIRKEKKDDNQRAS